MRDIDRLLTMTAHAHIVSVTEHSCRFGDSHQPSCLDCNYVGPFVSAARAQAIAREHTAKSVGEWEAAK